MKNLKIMSLLLGGLLSLGSLTSCGKDEAEVLTAKSATAEYVVNLNQELLNVADVTIYYIDSNGQQAQETVTSSKWTKTVNFTKLPVDAGFSVQPRLKGEPTQEAYTIEADGKMTITEIAPGIDLQKDILDQMDFKPEVAKDLKTMDPGIFSEKWGNLGKVFDA